MVNSRHIFDLHSKVAALCQLFIVKCRDAGIEVAITSTYRDMEYQAKLYAQSRTAPGPRVTNAKPGQSFHNFKVAFDFAPLVNGKIVWTDEAIFEKCGTIAESVGLEWAGRWHTFKELAHCQYTGGLTLADFQAGKTLD